MNFKRTDSSKSFTVSIAIYVSDPTCPSETFKRWISLFSILIVVCKNGEDYCPTVPVTCLTLSPEDERQVLHRDLCSDRSISGVRELLGQSRASLVTCLGICKLILRNVHWCFSFQVNAVIMKLFALPKSFLSMQKILWFHKIWFIKLCFFVCWHC